MQLVTSSQPLPLFLSCIHHNTVPCCCFPRTVAGESHVTRMRSNVLCPQLLYPRAEAASAAACCSARSPPSQRALPRARPEIQTLGARARVRLAFGLQPAPSAVCWSRCTTLNLSVRINTTGMLYAGRSAPQHTPGKDSLQCWRTWLFWESHLKKRELYLSLKWQIDCMLLNGTIDDA